MPSNFWSAQLVHIRSSHYTKPYPTLRHQIISTIEGSTGELALPEEQCVMSVPHCYMALGVMEDGGSKKHTFLRTKKTGQHGSEEYLETI